MKPEELRRIADNKNNKYGEDFWNEFKEKLFNMMGVMASSGGYEYKFNAHSNDMNPYNWLSTPHLYKPIIKNLEELGYTVTHCDDVRDGTYFIVKW